MFEIKAVEIAVRASAEDILILNELTALSKEKYEQLLDAMPDDPYEWDEELESRMAIWGRRIQFLEKIQKSIKEQIDKEIRNEVMEWQDDEQC